MKKSILFLGVIICFIVSSCKEEKKVDAIKVPARIKAQTISYHLENAKQWLDANTADSTKMRIALALNRTDKANFIKMDSVIIPKDFSGKFEDYLPFPLQVDYLKDINKIIYFSYPTQVFATYENGQLTYTGPTNMGSKKNLTPTGLFYTNWKAEETISTFDDEWKLLWNFNIENKLGVGWHQYELPGYPASHSCLRLQERDARFLYEWANQWELAGKDSVKVKGTPVIVFGKYDFNAPKPWLQLLKNPLSLDISADEIQKQTEPFLAAILTEQRNRTKSSSPKTESK